MLPREQRLRSNQEFQDVYRHGRSWAHPLAALHVHRHPSGQRWGVSVSKKVGKAVERNRVRRRIREILRELSGNCRSGFSAIVVVRAAAADASYPDLRAAIVDLARRARLSREPGEAPDTLYLMPAGGRPGREAGRGASAKSGRGAGASRPSTAQTTPAERGPEEGTR